MGGGWLMHEDWMNLRVDGKWFPQSIHLWEMRWGLLWWHFGVLMFGEMMADVRLSSGSCPPDPLALASCSPPLEAHGLRGSRTDLSSRCQEWTQWLPAQCLLEPENAWMFEIWRDCYVFTFPYTVLFCRLVDKAF